MTNQDSSRGMILEILFNIGAVEASIYHNIEAYIFYESDIKELIDVLNNLDSEDEKDELSLQISSIVLKQEKIIKLIKRKVQNRQKKMNYLESLVESYDKRMHCSIKHWTQVIETDTEILYNDFNKETLDIIKNDYQSFAEEISLYLNVDYTDCFRCLADSLTLEKKDEF